MNLRSPAALALLLLAGCSEADRVSINQGDEGAPPAGRVERRASDGHRVIVANPIRQGIYGDVRHGSDGDMGGVEIHILSDDHAAITICEGECRAMETVALRPGNGGWVFDFPDRRMGNDGRIETMLVPMTVSNGARGLVLRYEWGGRYIERALAPLAGEGALTIARERAAELTPRP